MRAPGGNGTRRGWSGGPGGRARGVIPCAPAGGLVAHLALAPQLRDFVSLQRLVLMVPAAERTAHGRVPRSRAEALALRRAGVCKSHMRRPRRWVAAAAPAAAAAADVQPHLSTKWLLLFSTSSTFGPSWLGILPLSCEGGSAGAVARGVLGSGTVWHVAACSGRATRGRGPVHGRPYQTSRAMRHVPCDARHAAVGAPRRAAHSVTRSSASPAALSCHVLPHGAPMSGAAGTRALPTRTVLWSAGAGCEWCAGATALRRRRRRQAAAGGWQHCGDHRSKARPVSRLTLRRGLAVCSSCRRFRPPPHGRPP